MYLFFLNLIEIGTPLSVQADDDFFDAPLEIMLADEFEEVGRGGMILGGSDDASSEFILEQHRDKSDINQEKNVTSPESSYSTHGWTSSHKPKSRRTDGIGSLGTLDVPLGPPIRENKRILTEDGSGGSNGALEVKKPFGIPLSPHKSIPIRTITNSDSMSLTEKYLKLIPPSPRESLKSKSNQSKSDSGSRDSDANHSKGSSKQLGEVSWI